MASIAAKKTAGLDRVRQLLSVLPPEVRAKLDESELKIGVALLSKKKPSGKAVIQSPSEGLYCWNGSNAISESEILERIAHFAGSSDH